MNKELWIARAKALGIDELEIYEMLQSERALNWYEGSMDSFTTSRVLGTSLRAIVEGKQAEMALEQAEDTEMDRILESLISQAKVVSSSDPAALRSPEKTDEVQSKKHFVRPSVPEIKAVLEKLEGKILAADPRIFQVGSVSWQDTTEVRRIHNSLGLSIEESSVVQIVMAEAAAKEGEEIKTAYKIEVVENLADFDADKFTAKLSEELLGKLGGKSLPTGRYQVILEKDAMTSLFMAMASMFSGEQINKGISPLRDKLGQQIYSELVTVVDDPRNTDALEICNYDDEGCPTRRKEIVKDGVFTTVLHSTKTAMAAGTESTGNGFKGSYSAPVSVRPKNCMIVPGEKTLEELQEEMGEGLVITDLAGLHAGINPVTTDFSLQCSGYYVKEGKKVFGVSLVTIAGNWLALMKEVVAVGSDLEWSYRSIACPSVLFSGAAISGE
ncbi:MAG: TldD/PmbA family protein [Lachnospiraceae bacterium]|nr:TldD/PmbA family protein [Lachnospiraceae bacterium]